MIIIIIVIIGLFSIALIFWSQGALQFKKGKKGNDLHISSMKYNVLKSINNSQLKGKLNKNWQFNWFAINIYI